ncbi:transposase [Streptomyces sp. BA2]|uniref:transposase n=1 Tax=Streptomyces sp. BA2 TaxID=436595 RepID=UPI001F22DD53|nr:transposase [Streptomyces sp. BA2]
MRCDLLWKAACGLGLNDRGFDASLLAYFRRRLARSTHDDEVMEIDDLFMSLRTQGRAAGSHADPRTITARPVQSRCTPGARARARRREE